MTIKEYRSLPYKSYSMLRDFLKKGRRYYYKKYILKEKVKEDDNESLRIGSAVDCLLFTPQEFEDTFYIGDNEKALTGKGGEFVKKLFELQEQGGEFGANAQIAYNHAELKTPKFEKYMADFEGSPLETVFINMIESKSKTILSIAEFSIAERIVKLLLEHPTIGQIFKREGFNQLPIVFDHQGEKLKGLLDRVTIDHNKKVIKPYDLKVTFEDEFFVGNWLKNKYYLQQGMYEKGMEQWRDENYPDYTIDPFRFIVINSNSINQPLVYELTPYEGDLEYGFTTAKNMKVKGFAQVLEEINWHMKNDIWDVSRDHHQKMNYIKEII